MRILWQLILPGLALVIFGAVSLRYFQINRQFGPPQNRYFFWGGLLLDSAPPAQWRPKLAQVCDGPNVWSDPSFLTRGLVLTGFPAFVVGMPLIHLAGHFGVSELSSFFVLTPILLLGWFYLIGRIVDRLVRKRVGPA